MVKVDGKGVFLETIPLGLDLMMCCIFHIDYAGRYSRR